MPEDGAVEPEAMSRAEFEGFLQVCEEQAGRAFPRGAEVDGIPIDLFELFSLAVAQKVKTTGRDWRPVAESLGIDWPKDKSVLARLAECYDENLAIIEQLWREYRNQDGAAEWGSNFDGSGDEAHDDGGGGSDEAQGYPSSTSTPPMIAGIKRELDEANLSPDVTYPPLQTKRPRLARDREVPSTPEESLGLPMAIRPSTTLRPSPVLGSDPSRQQPRPRSTFIFEPETQDFQFENDPDEFSIHDAGDADNGGYESSASQQLRSEFWIAEHVDTPSSTARDAARRPQPGNIVPKVRVGRRTLPPSFGPSQSPSPATPPRAQLRGGPPSSGSLPAPRATQLPGRSVSHSSASRNAASPNKNDFTIREEDIEHYISMGYHRNIVIAGFDAASGLPGTASIVMQSLRDGRGIPESQPGIWTEKDDNLLKDAEMQDNTKRPLDRNNAFTKAIAMLTRKHGMDRIYQRLTYLKKTAAPAEAKK